MNSVSDRRFRLWRTALGALRATLLLTTLVPLPAWSESNLAQSANSVDCETGAPLRYDVIRGYASVGDVIVGRYDDVANEGCVHFPRGLSLNSGERPSEATVQEAFKDSAVLWPGAVVPYVFHESVTPTARTAIEQAIAHYNAHTPIRWEPSVSANVFYVRFVYDPALPASTCGRSFVGVTTDEHGQPLELRCLNQHTILHEMGHAVGMIHTQQRPDRDDFIRVAENCNDPDGVNYGKMGILPFGDYDYASVMHYGLNSACTLTPLRDYSAIRLMLCPSSPFLKNVGIGQANCLSAGDVNAIWHFYRHDEPPPQLSPANLAAVVGLLSEYVNGGKVGPATSGALAGSRPALRK